MPHILASKTDNDLFRPSKSGIICACGRRVIKLHNVIFTEVILALKYLQRAF